MKAIETDSALSAFCFMAGCPGPMTGSGSHVPEYDSRRAWAERELSWRPAHPSWREGFAAA